MTTIEMPDMMNLPATSNYTMKPEERPNLCNEDEIEQLEMKLEEEIKKEQLSESESDSEFEFQFVLDDDEYDEVMRKIRANDSDIEEVSDSAPKPQCNICNKQFARKYNLERHMMTHREDRSFVCDICGKTIRGTLTLHQKVHSDYRPFNCEICGRSFRQKLGLKCHMMIHTGEKPFECTICNKKFRQKQSLQHHMPRHTGERGFVCHLCGRSFSEKSSLQKHSVIHSDLKPYQCENCEQTFRHKSSLVRHRKVHTRVTECHLCGRTFRYESFLAKHFKNAHMDQMSEEQNQISVVQLSQTTSPVVIQEPTHTIIQIEAPIVQNNFFTHHIATPSNPQIQQIQVRYPS